MKHIAVSILLTASFSAASAVAETALVDADENGTYSMAELVAAYPALSQDLFLSIDADEDGEVSAEELAAAQEAGLIAK